MERGFYPPNDNDIVFYPPGGQCNKLRPHGFLRTLLVDHFEQWECAQNKKDYIFNVILSEVGDAYFVDLTGTPHKLDGEEAFKKIRYQLDYLRKRRKRKFEEISSCCDEEERSKKQPAAIRCKFCRSYLSLRPCSPLCIHS